MVEMWHKDIGFPNETFRAVEHQVRLWSDTQDRVLGRVRERNLKGLQ